MQSVIGTVGGIATARYLYVDCIYGAKCKKKVLEDI